MIEGLVGAGIASLAWCMVHVIRWAWRRRKFMESLHEAHKSPPPWLADINDDALVPIQGHVFEIVGLSPGGLILAYRHPTKASQKRQAGAARAKERGEQALSRAALKKRRTS